MAEAAAAAAGAQLLCGERRDVLGAEPSLNRSERLPLTKETWKILRYACTDSAPYGSREMFCTAAVDRPIFLGRGLHTFWVIHVAEHGVFPRQVHFACALRLSSRALVSRGLPPAAILVVNNAKSAKQPPTAAATEQLKASRRAALARVASQKQKAEARRQQEEVKSDEDRRKREAEAAKRADALRSVAAARASAAAAEKRQRERERELARSAEAEAKRERVEAVLAYDEARADEREKQVRNETYARIRREERRRELALRRQEDERAEKMRLYEGGGRYNAGASSTPASVPPPAVQSARSFFSITGSAVSEKKTRQGQTAAAWPIPSV